MKTTIIKILNKIANGEEVPNKIYYEGNVYKALPDTIHTDTYYDDSTGRELYYHLNELNDEITILETTITYGPDKIGKLNIALYDDNEITTINKMKHLADKINEIIDRINEL